MGELRPDLEKHKWRSGQSGNPKGRPPKKEIAAKLAEKHLKRSMQLLRDVVDDETAPTQSRIAAANLILERGFGKAPVEIETSLSEGGMSELEQIIRQINDDDASKRKAARLVAVEGEIVPRIGQDT